MKKILDSMEFLKTLIKKIFLDIGFIAVIFSNYVKNVY